MERLYLCIDLKSFYASVECVMRGLDSLTTKLVVADPTRGNGAICLAVSPALKEMGVHNRCRIFEIPKNIEYICAMPRMKKYIEFSCKIYSIYLKYIAKEDIHVYSIDECFLDVTNYLNLYKMSAKDLAKMIIDDVIKSTGICATAGIGTNLFLAKVALDISAKHVADHIAYLDEEEFRKSIWYHKPITDVWNIGRGIANRLAKYGVHDLHGITLLDEDILYKEFGINAELIIDHAYGKESCTIKDIHNYKSSSNSLSTGQILFEDYNYDDALLVIKEMVDDLCLELVEKRLVASGIGLYVGYSKDVRKPSGGSMKLDLQTNSRKQIMDAFIALFIKTTDKNYSIRRLNIGLSNVVSEDLITFNLFTDTEFDEKEKRLQDTLINIRSKYGKNSILKANDFSPKATQRKRNTLIGGHNGE